MTGKVSVKPVANENASVHIAFDHPFPAQPVVVTNPLTSRPDIVRTAAANVDENGFDLYFFRTTSTQTSVMWLAVLA